MELLRKPVDSLFGSQKNSMSGWGRLIKTMKKLGSIIKDKDHMRTNDPSYGKSKNLRSMADAGKRMKMKNIIPGHTHQE